MKRLKPKEIPVSDNKSPVVKESKYIPAIAGVTHMYIDADGKKIHIDLNNDRQFEKIVIELGGTFLMKTNKDIFITLNPEEMAQAINAVYLSAEALQYKDGSYNNLDAIDSYDDKNMKIEEWLNAPYNNWLITDNSYRSIDGEKIDNQMFSLQFGYAEDDDE